MCIRDSNYLDTQKNSHLYFDDILIQSSVDSREYNLSESNPFIKKLTFEKVGKISYRSTSKPKVSGKPKLPK